MGQLLLEAMQVGNQIAAQRNQRLAQEEARRQRQAEAMALADYRREQLVNQARDDERAQRQAEALADYHKGQLLRQQQADIDAASNLAAIAEDRGFARDDRRAVANEKIRTEGLAEKFARGVGSRMYQPTEGDQDWAGIGGFEIPPGQNANDALAAQMAETGFAPPSVMAELARQDRPARTYAPSDIQKMINEGLLTKDQAAQGARVKTGQEPKVAADKPDISEADWISKHLQEFMKDPMKVDSKVPTAWQANTPKWMHGKAKQVPMTRDEAIVELRKQYRALYGGASEAPKDRAYNPKSRQLE